MRNVGQKFSANRDTKQALKKKTVGLCPTVDIILRMKKLADTKVWQIGFFTLNNTAVNIYYMMMLYIAYFASGVLGLGVALVSGLIAIMVVFDGVSDPVIGYFIDRTEGRFGKFRPFMVLGNIMMALSLVLMVVSQGLDGGRLYLFIVAYTLNSYSKFLPTICQNPTWAANRLG